MLPDDGRSWRSYTYTALLLYKARALVYEDFGQRRRARSELEKLYAEALDYEDVAVRLGL